MTRRNKNPLNLGFVRRVSLESDLVRHHVRRHVHLGGDAFRHGHGGHSARLGHPDQAVDGITTLVQELRDLEKRRLDSVMHVPVSFFGFRPHTFASQKVVEVSHNHNGGKSFSRSASFQTEAILSIFLYMDFLDFLDLWKFIFRNYFLSKKY